MIVLLLLALAATIGLATSHQEIADTRMTEVQEGSLRAFSAAEAGIEEVLHDWQTGQASPAKINLDSGKVIIEAVDVGEGEIAFTLPLAEEVEPGDFIILWLTDHKADGTLDLQGRYPGNRRLKVCWESNSEEKAALELVLFYLEEGRYKTERWAFDPERDRSENFALPDRVGCAGLPSGATIVLPKGIPLFLLVEAYYYPLFRIGAEQGAGVIRSFPSQGKLVTSAGEVERGEEVVSRRLRVFQSWDLPPLVFLEPLFSGGIIRVGN